MFGDKILRKKVERVTDVDNEIIELISNMWETMKNAKGVGLAASQVGADKKIFIVDLSGVEGYEETKPTVFINPEIVEYSEEQVIIEEGCLSIPDIRADVERAEEITIKYFDTDMKEKVLNADDLMARVIQHEYDHLCGILFTDLVDDQTTKKIKKSLQRIRARKIEVSYPVSENIDYQLTL
jgi:peptide deformylase